MAVVSRHRRDAFGEYFRIACDGARGAFGVVRALGVAAQCVAHLACARNPRGTVGWTHRCAGVRFAFRLGLACATHGVDACAVVGFGQDWRGAFGFARIGLQCVLGVAVRSVCGAVGRILVVLRRGGVVDCGL